MFYEPIWNNAEFTFMEKVLKIYFAFFQLDNRHIHKMLKIIWTENLIFIFPVNNKYQVEFFINF